MPGSDDADADADMGPAYPGETQFEPRADDADTLCPAIEIVRERGGRYLVHWEGADPATGKPWAPSWVPKRDCTDALIRDWKRKRGGRRRRARPAGTASPVVEIVTGGGTRRRTAAPPEEGTPVRARGSTGDADGSDEYVPAPRRTKRTDAPPPAQERGRGTSGGTDVYDAGGRDEDGVQPRRKKRKPPEEEEDRGYERWAHDEVSHARGADRSFSAQPVSDASAVPRRKKRRLPSSPPKEEGYGPVHDAEQGAYDGGGSDVYVEPARKKRKLPPSSSEEREYWPTDQNGGYDEEGNEESAQRERKKRKLPPPQKEEEEEEEDAAYGPVDDRDIYEAPVPATKAPTPVFELEPGQLAVEEDAAPAYQEDEPAPTHEEEPTHENEPAPAHGDEPAPANEEEAPAREDRLTALLAENARLTALTRSLQSDTDLFRTLYSRASDAHQGALAETRALTRDNASLRAQATTGVAQAGAFWAARVRTLEGALARARGAVGVLAEQARRTDDGVRRRAALLPGAQRDALDALAEVERMRERVREMGRENTGLRVEVKEWEDAAMARRRAEAAAEAEAAAGEEMVWMCQWTTDGEQRTTCEAVLESREALLEHCREVAHI